MAGPDLFTYPTLLGAIAKAAGVALSMREAAPGEEVEAPFGADGSALACDPGRMRDELGVVATPAGAWIPELVRPRPAASR